MKWAFVDYENIGSLDKIDLSLYERVIVFLGAKQPRLDFSDKKYDKPINLLVVQVKAVQANNLDFHLAYYLGKLDREAGPAVSFEVITNDTGFTPLISHIKNGGRTCKQVKIANVSSDLQKIIDSLKSKPKDKRPQKVTTLRNYIASHLAIKGNELAIQNQLNQLVSAKVITISDTNLEYLC